VKARRTSQAVDLPWVDGHWVPVGADPATALDLTNPRTEENVIYDLASIRALEPQENQTRTVVIDDPIAHEMAIEAEYLLTDFDRAERVRTGEVTHSAETRAQWAADADRRGEIL